LDVIDIDLKKLCAEYRLMKTVFGHSLDRLPRRQIQEVGQHVATIPLFRHKDLAEGDQVVREGCTDIASDSDKFEMPRKHRKLVVEREAEAGVAVGLQILSDGLEMLNLLACIRK
jgi:hypothetical protein